VNVEFETVIPEKIRGLEPYRGKVNWEALELVCKSNDDSELKRARAKQKLFREVKEYGIGNLVPRIRLNYVCARLALGDFSDYWGWEFRGYFNPDESKTWAADLYWSETWLPKWGGGPVKLLLVLGEQGIGDQIFFSSIIPEALTRCGQVVYECDDRLHSLLERSLRGLVCRPERDFEDRRLDYGKIDAYIPAAELMRMFRKDRSHFPGRSFLKADPERLPEFEKYKGRVGVGWKGRQGSLDPIKLGLEAPISLQYDEQREDIETPEIDLRNDIEGVTALCQTLDKVVTVPTSVHHISGGLGKRTEIILPEIEGLQNAIPWDYPTKYNDGKLLWYKDAQVFETIDSWRSSLKASRT